MSASFVRVFALGLALLASACASTYTDNRARGLSADRFGTLEQVDPAHSGVLIETIDGRRPGLRPLSLYRLAPGEHALRVSANVAFHSSTPQMVYFDVAPGGQYRVQGMAAPEAGEWGFAIVDAGNGQRVDRLWSQKSKGAWGAQGR